MMAVTVDGKIAKDDRHFPDWTGKADKKLFVEVTKKSGVMIMGSKTFDVIGRPLPNRKNIVITRNPKRISSQPDLIFTHDAPEDIIKELEKQGFEEATLIGGATINQIFAERGLIDELIITFSPFAFGSGISMFTGPVHMELALKTFYKLDKDTICARYRVTYKKNSTSDSEV